MMYKEHDRVVLTDDIEEKKLKSGMSVQLCIYTPVRMLLP